MALVFTDAGGNGGRIDDDLTVSHAGENGVAESVEAYLDERETDGETTEDVLESLMFELIGEYDIREIRQADGGSWEGWDW